jgi:hypothetical protein
MAIPGHLFEKAAAYRRLARPYFTREKNESPIDIYAIQKMCESLPVSLADVKIAGIR